MELNRAKLMDFRENRLSIATAKRNAKMKYVDVYIQLEKSIETLVEIKLLYSRALVWVCW